MAGLLASLLASLLAAAVAGSSSTVPCTFNRAFVGWTGAAPQCPGGAPVGCKTSQDCARLPGACCPHYGPGVGTCAGLSCVREERNATSSFCGTNTSSPGGGTGANATPTGACRLGSEFHICAMCNSGPCSAGNARCASKSECQDPSPAVSLTCFKGGHEAPTPSEGAGWTGPPPADKFELHPKINNVGRPQASQWVVQLAETTSDLPACGALCAAYENASHGTHLSRCQSFTRFTNGTTCFGHLDPVWLPLSGVSGAGGATITVADSGMVLRPCASNFDCSFNGECGTTGVCSCGQGWSGRRCETLDLLPVDKAQYGFSPQDSLGQNRSSWGGSILAHNGVWHMWAARMEHYCGIGQWEQNSKIVHATAFDVLGPYTEQDTVAGVFAHEPCVTRDPRTGELLMVSVNYPVIGPFSNASVFNSSDVCTCTANCTRGAVGSRAKCQTNCTSGVRHPMLPIVRTAPGVGGPWTETLSPVLGHSDSNLACWINGSGTLRCNGRGGGLQAAADDDWKNLSSWLDFKQGGSEDALWVSSQPDDEDPMPWMDEKTGVWHSIQHNLEGPHMCAGQLCQIGTHQFSLDGGRQWFYTGTAYTSLVHFTDGSSHLFDRRERPHMVFAENSTTPVALSNSARPGGLDGDRTFTLVQGLRTTARPTEQGETGVAPMMIG